MFPSTGWTSRAFPGGLGKARFANAPAGHAALLVWLGTVEASEDGTGEETGAAVPARLVFKATGAYHRGLAEALERAGGASAR